MTGRVSVERPAEAARPEDAPMGLTMLGSASADPATTDGHCDDGYCALP